MTWISLKKPGAKTNIHPKLIGPGSRGPNIKLKPLTAETQNYYITIVNGITAIKNFASLKGNPLSIKVTPEKIPNITKRLRPYIWRKIKYPPPHNKTKNDAHEAAL